MPDIHPPLSDADALWQQAPCAALRLWRDAGTTQWRLNRAAVEWSLGAGLADADWRALADGLLGAEALADAGQLRAGAWALDYRAVSLAPGWLLWLTPHARVAEGRSGWRDAEEKLALMQGFNRMGFFERSVDGDRDWWDKHMFGLMGREPALHPPSLQESAQRLHPDDRVKLIEHHRRSMLKAGRYEIRYRLQLPDGRQRDMHALTEVRNGGDGKPATMLGVLIDDSEGANRVRAQQSVSDELARALDLAMVSVWHIDLQRRRIHFNEIGYRITGVESTPDGIDLEVMRALAHPQDRQAVLQAAEQALAGHGVVDVEARYRNQDGSYRHLLTRRVAERDASGRVVALMGVSLDQTARIVERERAQALAQRIQMVADAAGVGVWTVEVGGEGEPEHVEWNAQMFHIYGLPPDQPAPPVRDWMSRRVHEHDRERVTQERRRARRAGRPGFETEFRIVRPDGSLRWVVCRSHREEHEGGRSLLHGIHLDLTTQRMLGEELNLHEHRLKLATQIAGVGIWERDMVTGAIVWEAQMYRLRGLQPDDPRTPREIDERIVAPHALEERWQRIERHMVDSEPYEYEFEVRWPDGSMHWLVSTGRAVRDDSGKVLRMVGLNWDITQRKRAEVAQRDAEAADRASRAKSEFLARMSHELRTPLNAILGFAQLLEHDGGARLDALQRERLARIRSAGTHLLSLIDEVLDLSAVEAGSLPVALQPIALDEAIEEVRQWLAPMAADSGLSLQVGASGAWVHADARRLRQVLANLMSNAIKYNRRGGQVSLAARRLVVDGVPGWELSVRDTGRGLSAEQQAHLYEPFNRLGAERDGIEGRGIGLMTVHHLVRLMGGRLQVNSRLGEGSEFRVWLTLASAHAASPPPEPDDLASVGASEQMSVLYVEDNAVNVLVMRELVALRPNITLHVAVDGHGGIEAALQHQPDLVLVDMQLPDMDGHELLRRLRAQPLPPTLIALSANAMPDAVAQARAAGFDDYWTKPIDVARLLAGLDRLAAAKTNPHITQED